ncbi:carbon monoxide dehydrogenase [Nocardioides sp. dk4132]|uniref:SRPBCC family protein n=1 Tax=unclassified Nocardioides TaxID=2615069 RepID=UPI001294CF0A|nr:MULTISPECIES: SRPBCC family protein [unclassified Nocardioides]MQW74628.1 carbon monoxide dehydrogenase [Nocardioides sp. dk4132]QGA06541.1 carbon monoxide dehydrogenase [Nocardioides sp. dk884]
MDLTHRFTVPTSVEETWGHFNDIASVAECFPGATVSSAEGDTFVGSVKVKLGPIALVYNGSGTFVEKDEAAHRFVVEAKGKDKRGNGTAGATVTVTMSDAGGSTDVEVLTDLAVTGKPAQFGRGVMQDVSDKLLGQFVACLEQRLAGPAETSPEPEAAAEAGAPEPVATAVPPATPRETAPDRAVAPVPPTEPAPTRQATPEPAKGPIDDGALDLGAAVVPALVKAYGKQVAAALGVLLVLRWLLGRRRG